MDDSDEVGQDYNAASDWHPADILAALKKRGLSLAGLSAANGYHATAAGKALKRPWPAMESLIAAAIDTQPHEIWPSRYKDGNAARSRSRGLVKKT
jgi:Ner family transcriptional regulator